MSNINVHNIGLTYPGSKRFRLAAKRLAIGNESVPKIIMNNTINLFIKITVTILVTQTITVSECCVIKLLTCVLFEKIYLYFCIGNGHPKEPALCQLYRHTFVP